MDPETPPIICHVWTAARKHPKMIGVIGGHAMPFVSTYAQAGAFIGTLLALLVTRSRFWGHIVAGPLQIILVIGLPFAAWFAVRLWHPDDRSPTGYLGAAVNFMLRPRHGRRRGSAVHLPARGRAAGGKFFFSGSTS